MHNVCLVFLAHARAIAGAIPPHHTAAHALVTAAAAEVEALALSHLSSPALALTSASSSSGGKSSSSGAAFFTWGAGAVLAVWAVLLGLLRHLYTQSTSGQWGGGGAGSIAYLPRITDSMDVAALTGVVVCVTLLVSVAGVPVVLRTAADHSTGSSSGIKGGLASEEEEGAVGEDKPLYALSAVFSGEPVPSRSVIGAATGLISSSSSLSVKTSGVSLSSASSSAQTSPSLSGSGEHSASSGSISSGGGRSRRASSFKKKA